MVEPIEPRRSAALEWWRALQSERRAGQEARPADGEAVQARPENADTPPPTAVPDSPSAEKDRLDERALKRRGLMECQACRARRYVDGSSDPGVSFKAPGYVSPAASGAAVRAHEGEHVSREQSKAEGEGREVIAQSVQIYTSVCPECGRVYVSGGKTTTLTGARRQPTPSLIGARRQPTPSLDFYA